jgi:Kef-type K+ transport system membrane component KefB
MRLMMFIFCLLNIGVVFASGTNDAHTNLLLWLGIITLFTIFARSSSKIGQPLVLGQLVFGMLLGGLSRHNVFGLSGMLDNTGLAFFAELGSIFLLLEIGLESSIADIRVAGKHSIVVAILGVAIPFLLGYFIVVPFVLGSHDTALRVFIGSTLAVTSTGISISIFKDFGILKSETCQIVLAASVIDDILGLVLLSVTVGLIVDGLVSIASISNILWHVILFFGLTILFGLYVLPVIIKLIRRINNGSDTIVLTIISFSFLVSYFAGKIGLAFIIGAFLAGLLLNPQLFKNFIGITDKQNIPDNHNPLEHLIAPYGKVFTPLFFIYAGMQVDIMSLFSFKTVILGLILSLFAVAGKLFVGVFLPQRVNKWLVGLGMVPRGEIGLIFAITGLELKIIDKNMFAVILLMVIVTSILATLGINHLARKEQQQLDGA